MGYGSIDIKLSNFSRKHGVRSFSPKEGTHITPQRLNSSPDFPKPPVYTLVLALPVASLRSLLRHCIAYLPSTGILTCFPSTTPLGLALGADSPCADVRCAGNLGFSACRTLTRIIVTHVSIRTPDTSSKPPGSPSTAYRTLLYRLCK